LLSVADRQQYLLVEQPHGMCVDLRDTVHRLARLGLRPILAHPEQCPEFLHGDGAIEELVHMGCVVQVSSASITNPRTRQDARRLKSWFRRGVAHVFGSDGHSPTRRPPLLAAAYRTVLNWIGPKAADRVCSLNGTAILQGLPLRLAPPERPRLLAWLPRWMGA
jgi:protein-tyrosine phosphatase